MSYPEMTSEEFDREISLLRHEGVDSVYLDRGEWSRLQRKLLHRHRLSLYRTDHSTLPDDAFEYQGVTFRIVQESPSARQAYEDFKNRWSINI